MRSRKWLCLLAAGAVSWAVYPIVANWSKTPRNVQIDLDACDKILVGMDERDVQQIIGGPAGDYSGGQVVEVMGLPPSIAQAPSKIWCNDTGVIQVWFDEDCRVFSAVYFDVEADHPIDILQSLFRIFGIAPETAQSTKRYRVVYDY